MPCLFSSNGAAPFWYRSDANEDMAGSRRVRDRHPLPCVTHFGFRGKLVPEVVAYATEIRVVQKRCAVTRELVVNQAHAEAHLVQAVTSSATSVTVMGMSANERTQHAITMAAHGGDTRALSFYCQ